MKSWILHRSLSLSHRHTHTHTHTHTHNLAFLNSTELPGVRKHDGELREPLVRRQRSQASMRVARQIAPPQCPCLENPRDGGAWWAAIYGVTQARDPVEVAGPLGTPLGLAQRKRASWLASIMPG